MIPGAHFRRLVSEVRSDDDWLKVLGIHSVHSSDVAREGYRLTLRANEDGPAELVSSDAAGKRAALATLAQLHTQYGDPISPQGDPISPQDIRIPTMAIEDAPAFPTRGVMLDISRDRVPTMQHLHETIDLLASLKINHLQLYTEHTFAYPKHQAIWQGCDPITPAEIVQLGEQCKSVGIELAANQNCFGHLHRWLAHPDYKHLAEIVGDETEWDFMGMVRKGPFSLCPTDPRSIEFVDGLLSELLPHFSSNLVNIGCDETADVGQGRSRDAVAARGWRVYGDFVSQVARCALDKGCRPMFWADIALENPECLAELPEDLLALVWGYEADSPFDMWARLLGKMERPCWVCPGTSSWRSITGRTSDRKANLESAARGGVMYGAEGFMVTDWGDGGHRQQWPITLRGLADAADAAWTGYAQGAADVSAVSLHVFGDTSSPSEEPPFDTRAGDVIDAGYGVAKWLDDLGNADERLRAVCGQWNPDGMYGRLHNASALYVDLNEALNNWPGPGTLDEWVDTSFRLDALARELPDRAFCSASTTAPASSARALLADECAQSVAVACIAADRGLIRRTDDGVYGDIASMYVEQLEAANAEHRRLWLKRSRPGGLDASCAHDERIIADLRTAAE